MKVINLFGAPSCGKSTTMLGLTYQMKMLGLNVENTPEFFKEMKPDVYHQEIISLNKQNASFFFEFYKTIKVIVKTLVFFGKIQNDYRKNKGEFFSVEFWKNYLEM